MMLSGRYTPVMLVVCLLMTGIAGAALGAHSAADGGERVDIYEMLHEETFTDNGEFRESEPPETPQAQVGETVADRLDGVLPATPQRDQWAREHIAKPIVLGAFWVATAGYRVGYGMASTLGVGVTKVILNGAVVGLLGGVGLYVYRLFRGVTR